MKRRNKLLTLAACAALLLSACSTELDTSANPDHAGAGEALLSVSLQFPGTATPGSYADNPVAPGVALDAEKEIRSIAFIAFTTGGVSVYLSTKPTFDANGFTEPLAPADGQPAGHYTAKFKIRSGDLTGTTTVAAVANFAEHGLTFDPHNFTIEKLRAMLTVALEADKSIEYPLLMTIAKELTLEEGNTYPVAFELERIMARVDVLNNAYNKDEPQERFVLTSARLLSTPTQGTLMGGQAIAAPTYVNSAVQATVTDLEADLPAGQPAKQQLAPMYVYENSNLDPDDATKLAATATAVEVTGVYQGKVYQKVVPFVTPERVVGGVLTGGNIVSIERNTRYLLEITAPTENDVEFTLKATDWAAGDQIDVKPDAEAPKVVGTQPNRGTTWDQATLTLDLTNGEAPEFVITVSGNREMKHRVETEYDENPTKMTELITVEPGKLTGYADEEAGTLTRVYKIKLPQNFKSTSPYPSNTKVILYNEKDKTEVNVKYTPLFVTDWKSSQVAAVIDLTAKLVDLKSVANGQTGTFSCFVTHGSELTTTLTNKGVTDGFYTVSTPDETDPALLAKYGPGKRVTFAYQALTDNPELAEIELATPNGYPKDSKKMYVKCFKKAYYQSHTFSPVAANTLVEGKNLYLAVNNGDHGTIDYTVYDDVSGSITLEPSYTNAVSPTNPDWANNVSISDNTLVDTYGDYQIVKRIVKVALPAAIKNPSAAYNFKVGANTNAAALLQLSPVYLAGTTITAADKAFAPVLVKGVWWAPINVGQTKISTLNNPSSEGGNLFQWGRKQALTWASPTVTGPKALAAPEVTQDKFITATASPSDWCNAPNAKFWNSGTDAAPTKTTNDPCPAGWRVPSKDEWAKSIVGGGSPAHQWQAASSPGAAQNGLLTVSGEGNAKLYFPAAGIRDYDGNILGQGPYGYCWASAESGALASYVSFNSAAVSANNGNRASGMTVRCVQDL